MLVGLFFNEVMFFGGIIFWAMSLEKKIIFSMFWAMLSENKDNAFIQKNKHIKNQALNNKN